MKHFMDEIPGLIHIKTVCCVLLFLNCYNSSNPNNSSKRILLDGRPGSLAVYDLNNDSFMDLIVTDQEAGRVIVFLGNGKGAFSKAEGSSFLAGNEPEDIALGDFNKDQHIDLAIANHEVDYITLLFGNSNGQFTSAPSSPIQVASNPHPHGIATGDFDGDGNLDLTIESWQDDEIVVLFGDGKGAFLTPHTRYKVGKTPYYKLRTGDLNGDQLTDIVTSNWGGSSITVLLGNNSKEGFSSTTEIRTAASPFSIAIEDMNADGNADLVIAHRLGNAKDNDADGVSVLLGDGNGSFAPVVHANLPTGKAPTSVATGDFNGDNLPDLAVANYGSNDVNIILGTEIGFRQAPDSPFRVGEGPIAVVLTDLNADGFAEIVTANSVSNDISVIYGSK